MEDKESCRSLKKLTTISIVTPSYNQGEYIEETIRSVISQEGDFFIDYVIMDGGSTDNSVEIIKRYDELIKNGEWQSRCAGVGLRWRSEKDRGQAHAINKGFEIAKGDIVAWINSDDLYCDGAFSIVSKHFLEHPEDDFVFGDGDVVSEKGDLQWEWLSRPYNLKLLKSYHFLWNDFTNYIMQQATFWKRDIFNKIGLLDESLHYAMDVEYWLRIGTAHLRAAHIPFKLGKFRMIAGTKSLSSATVFWPDSLELFRRYNGAKSMEPFLRYYFYNEGLSHECNLAVMEDRRERLLEKWKYLSDQELSILKKKAEKGFDRACLMLAHDSFLGGDREKSDTLRRTALSGNPWLLFHYRYIYLCAGRILGRNWSKVIKKNFQQLVQEYRMRRYLYRYSK